MLKNTIVFIGCTGLLFWLVCCTLSWYGTSLLIRASWDDYQHNAISFVVETSYLDWDTEFPSVIICETESETKLAEITDRIFGDPHDYNLDEVVKELVYFRGLSFYTLQVCGQHAPPNPYCMTSNFTVFTELVRSKCEDIIKNCKWNSLKFKCCEYFVPMDTELGTCYSLNSKQTRNKNAPHLKMTSNKETGPGSLYLEIFQSANGFILGEQEVPSITTLQTDVLQITPHVHFKRYIALNEIENQDEVRDVSIAQRNCKFMDESTDIDVYPFYSYTACCVQCRKNAQIKTCGCAHHLMPNTTYNLQCNIIGLECLNENYNNLDVLKASWSNRSGLVCHCIPSCTELEMSVIKEEKIGMPEDFAIVELFLDHLPSERYKRNIITGKLDLVVSMGGTTALFIGASILSFVEVFYYFVVRPIGDFILKRQKSKNSPKNLDEHQDCFPFVE